MAVGIIVAVGLGRIAGVSVEVDRVAFIVGDAGRCDSVGETGKGAGVQDVSKILNATK